MAQIDDLLEQAEAQDGVDSWVLITKYQRKEFYVNSDRAVNIVGRKIEAIKEDVSVQGENHSQYIEFIMDRYYDGIDIAEQTLAIHYEVGDASDEDAPINVYKNDTQIKFGWVVENNLTQYATTVEFCIWARGTLADGNVYVLKTLPQKYEIQRGLTLAGGIIEPSTNWYLQFALTMDEKVAQASESADRAEQAASSADGVVEIVTTARDEVVQKSSIVNTQHSEVESWRQEVEQFRNEAEQFRDEAFATTPDGYSALVEQVNKNTIKVDTIIEKADLGIKETASGENIHLTDSAESKAVEFALFGKARQQTTSGNQLFDLTEVYNQTINGITVSVENGKVKVSGAPITVDNNYNEFLIGKRYVLKANTNYTVKISEKIVGIGVAFETQGSMNLTMSSSVNIRTGSLTEESVGQNVLLNISNNIGNINKTFEIMLNEGTTALPWEPYTGGQPSPSPDYPQEIEIPDGDVVVKSCGKNFLKSRESLTDAYCSYTTQSDGSVVINGATTTMDSYSFSFYRNEKEIPSWLEKGRKYYISIVKDTSESRKKLIIQIYKYVNGSWNSLIETRAFAEFTIPEDAEGLMIRLYVGKNMTVTNEIVYPMISLDDGEYEPYKEPTTAIIPTTDFAGIPVSSGGNYTDSNGQQWICDEIVKYADGSGEKIQRVLKAVFDGSVDEGWVLESQTPLGNRYLYDFPTKLIASDITNKKMSMNSNFGLTIYGGTCAHPNVYTINNSRMYVSLNGTETLEEFKEYLASKPMTVLTALETPIRTPLTAEQIAEIEKVSTFYPVTNISNDFDCGMSVKYLADSKNYIDNQLALQAQAREQEMMAMFMLLPEETQAAMIENDINNLLLESEV